MKSKRRRMIAYTRVSTSKQANEGTSLGSQRQAIRAYCDAMGIDIVGAEEGIEHIHKRQVASLADGSFYEDNQSASGRVPRFAFDAAISRIENDPDIDGLICYDVDRYFRSTSDGLKTFEKCFKLNGKELICLRQNIDTGTDEGWLAFGMFLLFAEYELRKINSRTKRGKQAVRKQGAFAGGQVPYGYKPVNFNGKRVLGQWPPEYGWVLHARDMRRSRCDYQDIADYFNQNEVPGKNGKKKHWRWEDIRSIINYSAPCDVIDPIDAGFVK